MDVHDVGRYFEAGKSRALAPGMVLTVEPGIYIGKDYDKVPPLPIHALPRAIVDASLVELKPTASARKLARAACGRACCRPAACFAPSARA